MYVKDKWLISILWLVTSGLAFTFELDFSVLASDAINIMAIASAVYFAAYAGVQSSEKLAERLKAQDKYLPRKDQQYVFNTYVKCALLNGFTTIVLSSLVLLVADALKDEGNIIYQLLSAASLGFMATNFFSMWKIGVFLVNRVGFNR